MQTVQMKKPFINKIEIKFRSCIWDCVKKNILEIVTQSIALANANTAMLAM